ncbi:MAG: ATP-binding cassette domain-containing protein [Synergistaceae bacterium]|nr:ATP-binding cassette domain-containing protein [Synergistaceae bacterium]
MGWFDEQLRERICADEEAFSNAFDEVAEPLTGKRITPDAGSALREIANFYGLKINSDEDILKNSSIMHRKVELKEGWYKDADGVYLAMTKEGNYAALIPKRGVYYYKDHASGKTVRINSSTQHNLNTHAECFYRPFPEGKMSVKDLFTYVMKSLTLYDIAYIALVTFAMTLAAMIPPFMTRIIYSHVIHADKIQPLVSVIVFMICAGLSVIIFQGVRDLLVSRIEVKTDVSVRAAVMMKLINLPVEFFSKYSSGDLAMRATRVNMLCSFAMRMVFSVGLTALMSLIYLFEIFSFSPLLVSPALCIMLTMFIFSAVGAKIQAEILKKSMDIQGKEQGIIYAFINGIQKIKLAGAERRAFAQWASYYSKDAELTYNPPLFVKLISVFQPAISLIGMLIIYMRAFEAGISVENYMAFIAVYAVLSAAFTMLCASVMSIASIASILDIVRPILEAVPETSTGDLSLKLRGGIEVNNLSFKYTSKSPLVLEDISFKIRPGEYAAIVGRSGCGKSTLMRLLLGFEKPDSGVIYYDGNDIKTLNLKALRSNIGCVMQNSKLFPGSIYSNITVTAQDLSEEEAWSAAETAGIAEDIRKMPMKMNTMISEGSGTLSGGQVQRIIIARAVASKPKILLFDEATSALDNITQKIVADSLDRLKCTRIVIAHRLSTVKNCGRIIVIDKGHIAEEGTYDELMNRKGLFASLVERQRLGGEV